ncbi:hypothetical protein BH10BAC5_BH10BAC5_07810 [soil metagenome]
MIKTKISIVLLILIFGVNISAAADIITDKLDEMMVKYDKVKLFSGVVLLAKDGNIVYEKPFGYADWEKKTPVNKETLFNIASITKMFTATMIMQLEKEGKLSLSDPLNKFVNIYPDNIGSKITIDMLLNMKAGLGDYLMDPAYNRNMSKFTNVDAYLDLIKNEPLLFEPGTDTRYSNSGYAVLGGVIEKATSKTYVENLKERILDPLGMKNSFFKQISDVYPNTATPTSIDFSGNKHNMKIEASPSGAGGIFTNVEDLFKLDTYIRSSKILGEGARAGGTPGWNSVFAQYKDGYTLIVFSNFGKAAEEIESRFRKIKSDEEYAAPSITVEMKFYKILNEEGISALSAGLKKTLEENDLEYNDMHLNKFGYQLVEAGEMDKAIQVFKLNTELFPDIANTYDSLAEAYMNNGNKELAIKNYKKVLELRPQNENAKKMIEMLQK